MAALHGAGHHELDMPDALQERLIHSFFQTADWMRNREG